MVELAHSRKCWIVKIEGQRMLRKLPRVVGWKSERLRMAKTKRGGWREELGVEIARRQWDQLEHQYKVGTRIAKRKERMAIVLWRKALCAADEPQRKPSALGLLDSLLVELRLYLLSMFSGLFPLHCDMLREIDSIAASCRT